MTVRDTDTGFHVQYRMLGRTGLRVSVLGLGCGGPSRLGQRSGKTEKQSVELVRRAMDLGINFIDTAESYGTETIVGKALAEVSRDEILVSTKKTLPGESHTDPGRTVRKGLEDSLKRLKTDYVDVYHLHGVNWNQYAFAADRLAPTLVRLREEGKIRSVGITEDFTLGPGHDMLQRALRDPYWDVVMVGFNLLNPSARRRVFRATAAENVGVLVMFAVRRALSDPLRLKSMLFELERRNLMRAGVGAKEALDFLTGNGKAADLVETAYRFCLYEPGVHGVLMGTGNPEHLETNIATASKPPLSPGDLELLERLFGHIDSITGG